MTDYACQVACAKCRKTGLCSNPPPALSAVRESDALPDWPFPDRYTMRSVHAPIDGIYLACGCTIPEIIVVLIGTKGQQVYCFDHKQFSRIKPEQIANAKKKLKKAVAAGQGTFDDVPPY